MSIAENVKCIRHGIEAAAKLTGRSGDEITLIAATKLNGTDRIKHAIAAGISACGENRVQELCEKHGQGAYEGAALHFIGHLQRNKVNKVVGVCTLIQSVDSTELMRLISARAETLGVVQDVLIEVNIGGEAAKSGVSAEALPELLEYTGGCTGVRVRGLMAIPPITSLPGGNFRYFTKMYKLFIDINTKTYDNVSMDYLSMGMSDDYIDAIRAGSNMVRIGSAIFGARNL